MPLMSHSMGFGIWGLILCGFFFPLKIEQFWVHSKVERKVHRFPMFPGPCACTASLIINIPRQMAHLWQLMTLHWHIIIAQVQFTLGFTVDVVCSIGFNKHMVTCIHHYAIVKTVFTCLFILPANPWQPLIFFTIAIVLPFSECHVVGIPQYAAFSDWHLSFSNGI